jgi:hypothetical protein
MKYLSDVDSNRALVSANFRDEKGQFKDYDQIQFVNDVVDELKERAANNIARKTLIQFALESKYELALWKAVSPSHAWLAFTTHLQVNRVSVRDITTIKQIIDEEFKILLDDAKEDAQAARLEIEVRTIHSIRKGGRGLIITYDALDETI